MSDNLTLAEYRHPEMYATISRLRKDPGYQQVMDAYEELLRRINELDPVTKARAAHDVINRNDDLSVARGAAIHELAYDHAYEEIGALLGLSRQRVWIIASDWRNKFGMQDWPKVGRRSRLARRQQTKVS